MTLAISGRQVYNSGESAHKFQRNQAIMIIDDSIVIIYPACLILSLIISIAVLIILRGHSDTGRFQYNG
jgi:hypothetical protein